MGNSDDDIEVTCEFLQKQLMRAAFGARVTIPGHKFRQILKLAMRRKAFKTLGLDHLRYMCEAEDVTLEGTELRALLTLASKAHPRERRRNLRVI